MWRANKTDTIGVALTRLPFGSSPAPAHFSVGSDLTCDLANDLIHCPLWDPSVVTSPLQEKIPPTVLLDRHIPFGEALEADVKIPADITAGTDSYIDDIATATLATQHNLPQVARAKAAVLMALHLQFRPHAGDHEPIKRPDAASVRKLMAEGSLAETIIFLGWQINTRSFKISLPEDKATAWSNSIKELLNKNGKVAHSTLATLVGRLNHVAYIIPQARHFMNRIRRTEERASRHRSAKLSKETKKDLELWLELLEYAKTGISINTIIFRLLTSLSLSDACETGMGGYNPLTGKMWRYEFTLIEQRAFTLNTKEFLAAKITQQLSIDDDKSPFPCHLNIGDSKVAEAWLYKSNHDIESSPIQNAIAREMASYLIRKQACNYSQHLKGEENIIADSLSRDTHLSDQQILALFDAYSPPLLPNNPQIYPLSNQTISWIASLAQLAPKMRELQWTHTPSTLAAGVSGWNSCPRSHQMTPILKNSPKNNATLSSVSLWIQSKMVNSQTDNRIPSEAQLRERPQTMWLRPSRVVVGQTLDSQPVGKSASNSNAN